MSRNTSTVRVVNVVPGSWVVEYRYREARGARHRMIGGTIGVQCEDRAEALVVAATRRGHLDRFEIVSVEPEVNITWREPNLAEATAALAAIQARRSA